MDKTSALDPKTGALLQVAMSVAIGSPAVYLERSTSRALATRATEDEIADVLLAIARCRARPGRLRRPPIRQARHDIAAPLEEPAD
ncbi:MAG TPA: carboxymuconolactone decarboxylase family protein [Streptosporangiaceae bacterium]|nr:carboxymuconolactone decarboxylase family protein [Streptosporangiaceae bacterium]